MSAASWVVVSVAALDVTMLLIVLLRRELVAERAGRLALLFAALALPLIAATGAASVNIERSKSVEFCLSCHEMTPYGDSLKVDDDEMVPAAHFQNRRVARDTACYDCHTDYGMFGGVNAKIRGMRHVWVHYVKTPPAKIELYSPYSSAVCQHCHEGARSFEESAGHTRKPETLAKIKSGEMSCLTSGCHDVVHEVHAGGDEDE